MITKTISTVVAKQMIEAAAIRGVVIIGQAGGWSVFFKLGATEKPLGTQRTDQPRLWRSLDRCVDYLKNELHLARFELLDATNYSSVPLEGGKSRDDASARLRNAHEAASHDKWFREQVEQGLAEADDPATNWISNHEASESWAKKRAELAGGVNGSVA